MSEHKFVSQPKLQRAASPRSVSAGKATYDVAIGLNAETIQRALADPSTLSPANVVQLQRVMGNSAVAQLLGRSATRGNETIQQKREGKGGGKVEVGPAHDRYEQEADRVAASVQRSLPSDHVQRASLVKQSTPQKRARIQRLSVNDKPIKFQKATAVTLSVAGADGVYFFHEGPLYKAGSTVAVKPSDDTVGDTVAANAMLNKLSGGKAPKTITGNQYKAQIRNLLAAPSMGQSWAQAWKKKIDAEENPVPANDPYMGTAEKFKNAKLERFDSAQTIYVMGLAGGKSFRERVAQGQNATATALMPADLIKLGRATAIDIFMGNGDRVWGGNLGNWMVDTKKTLYLIDNVQAADLDKLRNNTDFTKTWDIYLERLKSDKLENTASQLARKILVSADIANKEDIKAKGRNGEVVTNVGWKGMIGATQRPTKKDPNKLIRLNESELKPEHLSDKEKYLMTFLLRGLTQGRDDIIRKLAPDKGHRSRSLKKIIAGGSGKAHWDEMTDRAQKLKDLG